jgi:hypothetical protein
MRTPTSSRREVAESAGISKDQQVTAVRVANVPAAEFEAAIESQTPPTVTALAEMGKVSRTEFAPPDTRPPTDPTKYADVRAQRQQLDQLHRMLGACVSLEKLGNAASVAEAVKRLDVDNHDYDTVNQLYWVARFTNWVADIVSGKLKPPRP